MRKNQGMRICVVYDCLYPLSIGGAERWYRNLADRLESSGHSVTYATRRQWEGDAPEGYDFDVIAVAPAEELYGPDGTRRIGQAVRFGAGVFVYLLRNGRKFDVVHMASFPYFSVLAAAAARPFGEYRLVVDWHEVWSKAYWRGYVGPLTGTVGYWIQRLCIRTRHRPFCFSRLHRERLLAEGIRETPTLLEGELDQEPSVPDGGVSPSRSVVFAGRHIREKRPVASVLAIAEARAQGLDVTGVIFGDGPERSSVLETIDRLGLRDVVTAPGFASNEEVESAIAGALCLLHPSSREGYGLVVVESAALGTPVVLAEGEDNAATELVVSGINGIVARSASPKDLAGAIIEIASDDDQLSGSTRDWFARNRERLSMSSSLDLVVASYESETARR